MENSKQIEQYRNNPIDGIVRMREDGTLYILTRDKNGIQNCEIINPTNKPKVFGYFAKLPILDKRDKQKFIEVDLCSFYQQCFPSKKLPDSLFWSTPTGHFPKGVFKFNWRLIQIG
jgi:hypothetical protein